MDNVDEFEMKPLTAGVGFHKKPVSLKEHVAKAGLSSQSQRRAMPVQAPTDLLDGAVKPRTSKEIIDELHKALEPVPKNKLKMTEVLPREITDIPTDRRPVTSEITPIEKIDFQIPDKNITGVRRGASDNLIKPLTAIPVSFASIFLDGAIVLALSLIFLMSLIIVTGVDASSVMLSTQTEFATQLSLLVLYLAVFEMYVIVSRSFFGKSIGEWTFDLQMGDDDQIEKATYPMRVLWRSALMLLTGFVLLPLLSLVTGRDVAASFTGLQLYRRNI
jgi:uncharacterized RDD family membrane protein YckC